MNSINAIIPIYNAERYLPALFDSLLEQTFQDFVLILVDDCSTDDSEEIIRSYQEKFNNTYVYIKNSVNVKQGETRNIGIRESLKYPAKYTTFLDADDWLEKDFFEQLFSTAESKNADIAICGIQRNEDGTNRIICNEAVDGKEVIISKHQNMHELAYINPAPYNKIYRTEKIANYSFMNMERSEDTCFFFEILQDVDKIVFTNKIGYHYRIRKDSLTGAIQEHTCYSMMHGFSNLLLKLKGKEIHYREELETQIFIRVACGGVCRTAFDNMGSCRDIISKTETFMNSAMPEWKTNGYLRLIGRNVNKKAFFLRICAFLYKIKAFYIVIIAYYFLLKVIKKDIRM